MLGNWLAVQDILAVVAASRLVDIQAVVADTQAAAVDNPLAVVDNPLAVVGNLELASMVEGRSPFLPVGI